MQAGVPLAMAQRGSGSGPSPAQGGELGWLVQWVWASSAHGYVYQLLPT